MKNFLVRILTIMLSVTLTLTIFVGCTNNDDAGESNPPSVDLPEQPANNGGDGDEDDEGDEDAIKQYLREGDVIYFGSYPQTEVLDATLLQELNNSATEPSSWTSYNYYVSNEQTDCMRYTDITHNDSKYRGVYINEYRPYSTEIASIVTNSFQDEYGYVKSSVYWFKYEPIAWSVVAEDDGKATMVCNLAIDSQAYQNEYYYTNGGHYTDSNNAPSETYANNYCYSTIRSWLNQTLYQTAFNSKEQAIIQSVEIDNSKESSGYDDNPYYCDNTYDKIWLLSYLEITTYFPEKADRVRVASDYAKSQGVNLTEFEEYIDNVYWFSRSPRSDVDWYVRHSNIVGNIGYTGVIDTSGGIFLLSKFSCNGEKKCLN